METRCATGVARTGLYGAGVVGQRKRPYRAIQDRGVWFDADRTLPELGDPESDIPGPLYRCLEGGTTVAHHRVYPSLRDAEEALFHAWTRASATGWRPEG